MAARSGTTHLLTLFAALSIGLAVTAVWGRMTLQRSRRAWVSRHLIAACSLDVNHVVQSALGAVSVDGFLMVQLCGSRRDLGGEFVG